MLSTEDVLHIAKLANVVLTEEEVSQYQKWLSEALEYVKVLEELDTTHTTATYQVTSNRSVFRQDVEDAKQHLTKEQALKNVPLTSEDGYFGVESITKNQWS